MTSRNVVLGIIILFALWQSGLLAQSSANSCLNCHLRLEQLYSDPAKKIVDDIHQKEGISCGGCHGGDPTAAKKEVAMSPQRGFKGAPLTKDIPGFCGRCHSDPDLMRKSNPSLATDQLEKYWTSKHGQLLKKGDSKVAQCVSCHSVHDIRAVSDSRASVYAFNVPSTCARCHANPQYMASYGIPTNQHEQYRSSVHGIALLKKGDIGAPACNDCHGNHAAMPPGFASVGKVCLQCHPAEGELFEASPHKDAFDALQEEECVFCHGNHAIHHPTDIDLGVGGKAVCVKCHEKGDEGYLAAADMRAAIDSLSATYDSSKTLLAISQQKGVEVSDALFRLKDVQDALVNARKLVHAADREKIISAVDTALVTAKEIKREGQHATAEVKYRRMGLVVFTVIILALLVIIYVKIRRVERKT